MNILFLDMDGVLNNGSLTRKWFNDKILELDRNLFNTNEEFHQELRRLFAQEFADSTEYIFPELANRLTEIIKKTNLKIIWSSTWKELKKYKDINIAKDMFNRRGLIGEALIDYTPNYRHGFYYGYEIRVKEILKSIELNKFDINKDKISAIDDMNLIELEDYNIKFFNTDPEFGLTEKIKNDMINYYLNQEVNL